MVPIPIQFLVKCSISPLVDEVSFKKVTSLFKKKPGHFKKKPYQIQCVPSKGFGSADSDILYVYLSNPQYTQSAYPAFF